MRKFWLVLCMIIIVCSATACSNEPPDIYMTPASNEGGVSLGARPVIILDNGEDDSDQETTSHRYNRPATVVQVMDVMMFVVDGVNIRESNDMQSPVISTLEAGAQIKVTGKCDNGWYRVTEQAKDAYVNGEFLSETMPHAEAEAETTKKETTAETTAKSTEPAKATQPDTNTEAVAEGGGGETEAETPQQTEPETTKVPVQMVNTYTVIGVVSNIGTYGFSIQGKDKKSYQFNCAPSVTASMKEGGYVVVTYRTTADTGQTELVSVSGQ